MVLGSSYKRRYRSATAARLCRALKSRPGGTSSLSKPGWSGREAGLICLVGDEAWSLERLMVESRAVVRNAASVHGHVRLPLALDGSSVSLHRPQEVRVRSEEPESRGVVHVKVRGTR
jgi:hypothetical protein